MMSKVSSQKSTIEKSPQVSIGMPVYNGEKFICEALDSLLKQEFTDFELIISDNASTDRTEDICREYAAKDPRIRYLRQPYNIGGQKNFSFVVDESRSQYFTWLAHDDVLNDSFLDNCVDFLDNNPGVALVSGDFLAISESGSDIEVKQLLEIRLKIPWQKRAAEFYRVPISNAFFCIYGLMRKDVLVEVLLNIREGPLMSASELPLLSRFAAIAEIVSLPVILRQYRYHEKSAFHVERNELLSYPVKGRIIRCYNRIWHRFDQFWVLIKSSNSFLFKLHVGYIVLRFNLSDFLMRCRRNVKKIRRSLRGL